MKDFYCPVCGEKLELDEDFDFEDSIWECDNCKADLEYVNGRFVEYNEDEDDEEEFFDFFNAEDAVDLFNEYLEEDDENKNYAASVLVKIGNVTNEMAVVKFIKKIMINNGLSEIEKYEYNDDTYIIGVEKYLDADECPVIVQCGALINTYLESFFTPLGYVGEFDIYCQALEFNGEMSLNKIEDELMFKSKEFFNDYYNDTLYINEKLYELGDIDDDLDFDDEKFQEYNITIADVEEELTQKVNEYK